MEEKKAISRAQKPQALNCPRCNSSHTKFCYYNNYNLSQPRYFCKTCRRYWTAGGSLRNVPVGGGSRKNKRSSSSSSSSSSRNHHDHMMMSQSQPAAAAAAVSNLVSQNPNQHIIIQNHGDQDHLTISTSSQMSAMGFFKTNDYARGMMMMNSFMPMPVVGGSSNSTMMMNSLDGFENEGGSYDDQESGGGTTITAPSTSARLFFPLEDLKPSSGSTAGENEMQGDHSNCNAYWSGGGSW